MTGYAGPERRQPGDRRRHRGPGPFESWFQLMMVMAVGFIFVVALGVGGGVLDVRNGQQVNRRAGYQNRAAVCTIARGLRMTLPDVCLDPHVTRYFDPNAPAGGTQPSAAVCAIARQLNVDAPGC